MSSCFCSLHRKLSGFRVPVAFGQIHFIVYQQRSFAELHVCNRFVVFDYASHVGLFGVPLLNLGLKQQIE